MIHTLLFIGKAHRNNNIREKIICALDSVSNIVIDIGPHRLWFNSRTKYVIITCNNQDYLFYNKMVSMRMGYSSLLNMLNGNWEDKLDMDYIHNINTDYIFNGCVIDNTPIKIKEMYEANRPKWSGRRRGI